MLPSIRNKQLKQSILISHLVPYFWTYWLHFSSSKVLVWKYGCNLYAHQCVV